MAIRRVAVPLGFPSAAAGDEGASAQQLTPEKTIAATESTRRQLNNLPFVGGVWIRGIVVPASPGSVSVSHGLATVPQGYIVTKSSASPTVWAPSGDFSSRSIRFYNSAASAVTIDAWIF